MKPYTFFAARACKQGYERSVNVFVETAGNEMEHAEVSFNHLKGNGAEITAAYPAGKIGDKAHTQAYYELLGENY